MGTMLFGLHVWKGANYLMDNLEYEPKRVADSYELLGAFFVDLDHERGGR